MAKRKKKSTFERLNSGRFNRTQRRELGRKLVSNDPGLSIVNPDAGGIDVGNESHFVAVPGDRDPHPVQEFGCWTDDLKRMGKWLLQCRIDTVVLQATGVYWMAIYDILTELGIRVVVVNAQHTKTVPGRKSDVQECQWLMKLHTYGLLRNSFHVAANIEKIRTIWRLRDQHVKDASQAVQHMQKALTTMNIQIANVFSDISGVSGQAIIGAILKGERDPYRLADLKHERAQASREEVVRSLEGNWREDLLFQLQQAVDSHQFAQKQMEQCDEKLKGYLASLPTQTIEIPNPAAEPEMAGPEKKKKAKETPAKKRNKAQGNAPAWDLRAELKRTCGVDLTSIDGIGVMTAQTIVAELGTDLSAFPNEDEFASWLGLTPNHDITGGKVIRRGRRKVKNRVAQALRMAATSLKDSHSYLGARYRHLCRQLPTKPAAVKAMAHYLALLVYRLFTKGQEWVDRGAVNFEQKRDERELKNLKSRAKARGFNLTPIPT